MNRRDKQFLWFLFISCVICFKIKSDENLITYSSSKRPRIQFTIEKEPKEEIEELELSLGKQHVAIPILKSNEYQIELPDSFQIQSGRYVSFEIYSVISEKKCSARKDINTIELICEEEERIKPISAKLGIHENQNEIVENQNACFDESNELRDSCSIDLNSFVSMKCSNLQTCSPFLQMDTISQRTNCDPLSDLFVSVAFKCLRQYSFIKKVCFQYDLEKKVDFSASLIPDSDSYPLFKGNLVVFFTTTIPQQCETDSNSNMIEVWLSQSKEMRDSRIIPLEDSSTIYEADFGKRTSQTYTITISFAGQQLLERTITVSSATVITSPPTPFDSSVAISADSSCVTFKWKKLNTDEFTKQIVFDCNEFKGIAYYHFGEPKKREEAKKYCNDHDESLLPTMRSTCRLNKLKPILEGKRCWIGLTDIERKDKKYDPKKNTYQWDDGSTEFSMTNEVWNENEPNNMNNNEHCYELFTVQATVKLNDNNCEDKNKVDIRPICEKRNFDCEKSEPKYTILIYDEEKRFLEQYQYNDDIREKEEFNHQISELENNKKYHYSIRSENCGVSKSTEMTLFNYCFDQPPSQIEKKSYQVGVDPERNSFSFQLILPFFGIICSHSDSELMKTIKITTNDEHYECSANPNQFKMTQKTSSINCELKSNQKHSSSVFLEVSLVNGSTSKTTTITVHLCPFFAESCNSDCFEICKECSSFLDASSCVDPCSWCSSSKDCLASTEECQHESSSSSSIILILICVLIPVFVLILLIAIIILYRHKRRSTVDKLDSVLATTNITVEDSDFQF